MHMRINNTKRIGSPKPASNGVHCVKSLVMLSGCALLAVACVPALAQVATEDAKLLPLDGRGGNRLGWAVAIDNGVAAVGAYGDNDNGSWSGSVYLYDVLSGTQFAKLVPSDGQQYDEFGKALDIDNGIVAVAALQDDDTAINSGAVYLFDISTGTQLSKLVANDGQENGFFGRCVAIDNGVVAVGTLSGSAYLFDADTGTQSAMLVPTDGLGGNLFGDAIAIADGIVVVGASGSAYLFDAVTGDQIRKLTPSDAVAEDLFGYSVAIDDGVVVVGAAGQDSGAAYVFDAFTGVEISKLQPSDGDDGDLFGNTVAIENGVVVVGSRFDDDNGSNSGSLYQFDAMTGAQITKFWPSDGAAGDELACDVAISSGTIVAGAWLDDDHGTSSGSAYLFNVMCPSSADTNHDGQLTPADFSAWIAAFNSNAPECDQNGDGTCTPADFTAWIANYNAGCP